MTTAPAIHCVHCPLPVHPTRGGTYCVAHTPADLTGGVSPLDHECHTTDSKGRLVVPRMLRGESEARLHAAGWERIEPTRGGYVRWRDPRTGRTRPLDTAVRAVIRAQLAAMYGDAS